MVFGTLPEKQCRVWVSRVLICGCERDRTDNVSDLRALLGMDNPCAFESGGAYIALSAARHAVRLQVISIPSDEQNSGHSRLDKVSRDGLCMHPNA